MVNVMWEIVSTLTGLVHLCLCFQTEENILQRCHGDAVVDHPEVGLGVQLREQA